MKTKVAIACQGGGSQTTFTAYQPEFLANFDISQPVRIPKAFSEAPDKPYHIPWIEMSDEMQRSLDYEGKLDRRPNNVETLIAHGEERGRAFLAERARRVGSAGNGPADRGTGPRRRM